jgi:hypothetical protein
MLNTLFVNHWHHDCTAWHAGSAVKLDDTTRSRGPQAMILSPARTLTCFFSCCDHVTASCLAVIIMVVMQGMIQSLCGNQEKGPVTTREKKRRGWRLSASTRRMPVVGVWCCATSP